MTNKLQDGGSGRRVPALRLLQSLSSDGIASGAPEHRGARLLVASRLAASCLAISLLAAGVSTALPPAALADDAPPGLLGKWGAQGAANGCRDNYFTIAADGGITVVEAEAGPRRIMTYTIDGATIVVNNAGHLERAPFKIDAGLLILNPGAPQENRYARCAS